jgi:hypothetical protein
MAKTTSPVFEPPPSRSSRAGIVSAPVSREVPTANPGERRQGRVTLSIEEKDIAPPPQYDGAGICSGQA